MDAGQMVEDDDESAGRKTIPGGALSRGCWFRGQFERTIGPAGAAADDGRFVRGRSTAIGFPWTLRQEPATDTRRSSRAR